MSFRSHLSEEEEEKEYYFKKEQSKPMTIKRTSIMEITSNDITEMENAAFKGQELYLEKMDASSQQNISHIDTPSSTNTERKLC